MKVPHVFIDTSIFIANNYDYSSTGFRQIKSLVKQEKLLVYLTRVTVGEVERHIAKDVSAGHEEFDGFRRKSAVRILKNVSGPPLHNIFQGFDVERAKQELLSQFHAFLDDTKANVLELTDLSVAEVFEKYFAGTPPFANHKKPSEFPDAFSLAAIERWCKTSSGKMYVVSTDSDWQQVCAINPSLKYAQSLPEFLDLLSQGQKLSDDVSQLFKTHQDAILEKIRGKLEPLNLNYEPYGDVQYVSVNSVRMVKHFLIEVDDGKAVFEVITEVSYSANVLYRNNALMMTIGIPGAREEMEYGSTNVGADVTITFDQKKLDWIAIDSVDVKHDGIYLFPDEEPEDFARKFTLAQKAFSKHALTISELLGGTAWVLGNTPETIIQRFDEKKGSLPMRVILDLQTLSMLNQATGGLSFSGANSIKDFVTRMTKPGESRWSNSYTTGFDAVTRHAFEAMRNVDKIANRPFLANADIFRHSAIDQMIELTKNLHHSSLSGHSFARNLLLNINPKRSDESQTDCVARISVEVSRNTDVYGSDDDATESKEESDLEETPPFEFGNFPLTVTLNHNLGKAKPRQTHHKLRQPSTNQWEEWGRGIERTIRYLSTAEIEAELDDKDLDKDSVVSTQIYSEWEASERLYDQVLLEVAGFKLGNDDPFPPEQFRSLSPHLVKDILFEIKSTVIKRLYRCYCELERQASIADEQTVLQYIEVNSESFQVRHILRSPTTEESDEFRTTIIKANFAKDDENREVVDLKLDLSVAATFYDRLLNRIENATVGNRAFNDATRDSFLHAINPVYKLRVLEPLLDVNAWYFTIDDFTIP